MNGHHLHPMKSFCPSSLRCLWSTSRCFRQGIMVSQNGLLLVRISGVVWRSVGWGVGTGVSCLKVLCAVRGEKVTLPPRTAYVTASNWKKRTVRLSSRGYVITRSHAGVETAGFEPGIVRSETGRGTGEALGFRCVLLCWFSFPQTRVFVKLSGGQTGRQTDVFGDETVFRLIRIGYTNRGTLPTETTLQLLGCGVGGWGVGGG